MAKRLILAFSLFLLAVVSANSSIASATTALWPSRFFPTCSQLREVYPQGVAVNSTKAKKQISKPKVSASVYRANKKLDVDNDGTVCEAVKPKASPAVLATVPSVSTSVVTSTSTAISFRSEVLPFNGTVTGAYLGPVGSSSFPPARSFVGKAMCEVQNVKSVNFDYRNGSVTPCSQTDFVILKYSGLIPKTDRGIQSVQIQASYDDGIYLSIDGVPVLDKWRDCVCSSSLIIPNLDLNVDHSFELWYYENSGEAFFNLKWQSISTTSTTRSITTITAIPITSLAAAPITTTTICAPNQQAISSLKTQAGSWLGNRSTIVSLLKYEGSLLYGTWGLIFDSNYSNYSKTLLALNSCKIVSFKFDDYEKILNKARYTRDLKTSDSVTFAIAS